MTEISGELVFGVLIVAICAVLVALGNISAEDFMKLVFAIIGSILGIGYGYAKGYVRGKKIG